MTFFVQAPAHPGAGGLGRNSEAGREEPEAGMNALGPVGGTDMEQIDLWGLNAPTRRTDAQGGIGWTPADREFSKAVQKRESKAQRILARLKEGPATSIELAQITHRFSARILELRRSHTISREDHVHGGVEWSTYRLEGEK
jgi:hypothetical protein